MDTKKVAIGTIAVLAVVGGWAAFRPELLFVNKTVHESFPAVQGAAAKSDAPVAAAQGQFRSLAHETKGTATVYRLPDGKQTLRLTNFATSNGPDVHVYLVAAKDAPDNATVQSAGYLDLGSIKGNQGDQNYDLPAERRYEQIPGRHHLVRPLPCELRHGPAQKAGKLVRPRSPARRSRRCVSGRLSACSTFLHLS